MTGLTVRQVWLYGCMVAILAAPAWSIANTVLSFTGKAVVEVLKWYENHGDRFLYSTATVPKRLVFLYEPTEGPPHQRLAQALDAIGLTLIQDEANRFRIVRRQASEAAPPQTGRVVDAQTGEPIVIEDLDSLEAKTAIEIEGVYSLHSYSFGRCMQIDILKCDKKCN